MMKLIRLLFALYFGFLVYSALDFYFGDTGFIVLDEMEQHKIELGKNIENLKSTYQELEDEFVLLKEDPEQISLRSRSLSFYDKNEYVVKIEGFSQRDGVYKSGNSLSFVHKPGHPDPYFRAAGLMAVIVFFFLSGIFMVDPRRETSAAAG